MDAPNYNDGNWHGWDGGECPVHPESEIEAFYMVSHDGAAWKFANVAGSKAWGGPCLFRVTKEHREPRRFWIGLVSGMVSNHPQNGMIEVIEATE